MKRVILVFLVTLVSILGVAQTVVNGGGTVAVPSSGPRTLYASNTDLTNTGSTSETILATATVPAGTFGANSRANVTLVGTDGALTGTCTYDVRWGTSNSNPGSNQRVAEIAAMGASRSGMSRGVLAMRNSLVAEIGSYMTAFPTNTSSSASATAAVNTATTTTYFLIDATNSNSADTCTVSQVQIELWQ